LTIDKKRMSWEEAVLWLKAQPEKEDLVRACFFDDPLLSAAERYYKSSEWQAVRAIVGLAGGQALDVGSGRGISAYALAKDGWKTVALEPDGSDEVGAGAVRRLSAESGVTIAVAEEWGERMPFDSCSFDLVHCRQALHHAHDLRQLCQEIARVLKPEGMVIATRDHVISRVKDLPQFLTGHPLHNLYGGENAFLLNDYLAALTDAGIRLTLVLNSFESDINTYPATLETVRSRMARKLRLPTPRLIPKAALSWRGRLMNTPGRVYTFVGRKCK
jgi:SAM-dependent methyltransferase